MPSVTYDGRSFMIDGRRIWIVSASIPFNAIPRSSWEDRIHAAKLAGFNTIEAPVVWSRVEPRPGQFDFKGEGDVKHFVQLVAKAGMWCILRPGPYTGDSWELGGIPAWIQSHADIRLRAPSQPFLEACSRYIGALAHQLSDLQVTAAGKGGPILLIQVESQWACSHEDMAASYLGELNRYLRESGFNVPTINANNLWQGVESEIDCWVGEKEMLRTMRQLTTVLPDQPRLVIDFGPKSPGRVGEPAGQAIDPLLVQREMGEILAGGAQFNLVPFAAAQVPGFWVGQSHAGKCRFLTPLSDLHAPIDVLGRPTERYHAVRAVATFASHFGKVFANLDPAGHDVVLDPTHPGGSKQGRADFGPTVVHRRGSQGSVVFIFSDAERGTSRSRGNLSLLLPDGSRLPVELSGGLVHWCAFDVHLSGRSVLTYSSLCVLGLCGQVLVVFGGAGTVGHVAINGSPLEVEVPAAKTPLVIKHENVHLVVVSDAMVSQTFIAPDAVYVGVQSLDAQGNACAAGRYTRIASDGSVSAGGKTSKKVRVSRLNVGAWEAAPARDHADGTNPRYATIPGPAKLADLGATQGYGWYRAAVKMGSTRKVRVMAPGSEDRFQLIVDGIPAGVMGAGPGAEAQVALSLKKGDRTIVVLADNMGHLCEGSNLEWRKGLCGPLWEVSPVKLGKPKLVEGAPMQPMSFRAPLFGIRDDDQTHPRRVSWTVAHRRKTPLFMVIEHGPARGLVLVNDAPVRFMDAGESATITLEAESLKRGNNVLEFAPVHEFGDEDAAERAVAHAAEALGASVSLWEGVGELTGRTGWAFAKWERPMDASYGPPPPRAGEWAGPTWWRVAFDRSDPADSVVLHLAGLTKGFVFVNDRPVGRYFVARADGTPVPPQETLVLHAALLAEGANELLIFDEHGGNPAKCKLTPERPDEAIFAAG
ncbi:MAG: beta-galactosidase [Phycisphaerales bacterium]|nr:beta-galactosidase [Phycisphaerales bacterium]